MIPRAELLAFLDDTFKDFQARDVSKNGMQIQAPEKIGKVAFAVDACLASFEASVEEGADILIVHHGLFWKDIEMVTDHHFRRLKTMLENNVGLYAIHLPLDAHQVIGNNRQLAACLNAGRVDYFSEHDGLMLGCRATFDNPVNRDEMSEMIDKKLNTSCFVLPFGPEEIKHLGIISGGGAKYITDAITAGCDSFLTGEPEHIAYHMALEYRVNFFAAGHYASETVGLLALQKLLEARHGLETVFLDIPTGM